MNRPVEPKADDCCNSGCNPCIFDVYERQLLLYKKYEQGENSVIPVQNAISQLVYCQFLLVKSVVISNVHKLLVFKQLSRDNNCKVFWKPGDYFLLKYSDDQISCSRAYTPINPLLCCQDDQEIKKSDFAIIVKKYHNGSVSNFLYNLSPECITHWRGPYGSYDIQPNTYNRIIMIAQGTGVLPFITIIDKILENEDDMTKLILYYCCENDQNILLRDKLYAYKCYWNFTYKIFFRDFLPDAIIKYSEPIITHKLTLDDFYDLLPLSANDQFLLCGSSYFMEEYQKGILSICPVDLNIKLF